MPSRRAARLWAGITVAATLCGVAVAQGNGPSMPLAYCSTTNTADMLAFYSDYQSMGRCKDNCTSIQMPLAIVQWKSCWCSNLIPAKSDQKPIRNCQNPCPGYPDDYCGGSGTFGYIELSKNGLSTASPGATNTKTSATKDDSPATPVPSVQTVTVGGVIKTVTATPTSTADGKPELATEQKSSGLSTGATVGIAVGVVIGIVAIAGVFLVWWFLKRKRRNAEEGLFTASRRGSSPGMIATPKTGEVSENRFGDAANPGPIWDVSSANSKRRSHLMPVDPRLDPFAKGIYVGAQNKSHESFNSLQDNQDYSRRIQPPQRVLRAVNPDPDED